jgi:hypothetical protein
MILKQEGRKIHFCKWKSVFFVQTKRKKVENNHFWYSLSFHLLYIVTRGVTRTSHRRTLSDFATHSNIPMMNILFFVVGDRQ